MNIVPYAAVTLHAAKIDDPEKHVIWKQATKNTYDSMHMKFKNMQKSKKYIFNDGKTTY